MRRSVWTRRRPWRAAAALVTAAAAGYWAAGERASGLTVIRVAACGVAPLSEGFALPIDALRGRGDVLPISVGPIPIAPEGAPIHVRFFEAAEPRLKRASLDAGVLSLPLIDETPREIVLACRHDQVAAAHYRYADAAAKVPVDRSVEGLEGRAGDG